MIYGVCTAVRCTLYAVLLFVLCIFKNKRGGKEGTRKKEEGGKKEGRKKEEGRRKKEEGRKKEENWSVIDEDFEVCPLSFFC